MFQDRARQQGNINKKDDRDFLKSRPPARHTIKKGDRVLSTSRLKSFELLKMFKRRFDALEKLYRPEWLRVVEAVLNNSFKKD